MGARVSPWLSWAVPPSSRTLRGLFSLGFLDQMFPDFDTSFGPRHARSVRAEARERGAAAWPEWRVYLTGISGALKVHLDPSRALRAADQSSGAAGGGAPHAQRPQQRQPGDVPRRRNSAAALQVRIADVGQRRARAFYFPQTRRYELRHLARRGMTGALASARFVLASITCLPDTAPARARRARRACHSRCRSSERTSHTRRCRSWAARCTFRRTASRCSAATKEVSRAKRTTSGRHDNCRSRP